MARVVVINWVTLDGVMQGPGREDEDTREGFDRGGWAAPYSEETVGAKFGERMSGDHRWLFGRRSYEELLASWNRQGGPFKDALNEKHKFVASSDPSAKLDWPNSSLLGGDAAAAVNELREMGEGNLIILGSGVLIGSLMEADAIDEYVIAIAPLVLGKGRRLFSVGVETPLSLVECTATRSGAIVASYVPAR